MNLSAELFEEITEHVTIVSRDQPRESDRRAPRLRLSTHLSVAHWAEPQSPLSVRIRDLSIGGIGVFHNQRISLDEQLVIRFPRREAQTALVMGTVVYWEPLAENLFGVGVQFQRIVEEAELARQAEQTVKQQISQVGALARFTQAFARTWRIAS